MPIWIIPERQGYTVRIYGRDGRNAQDRATETAHAFENLCENIRWAEPSSPSQCVDDFIGTPIEPCFTQASPVTVDQASHEDEWWTTEQAATYLKLKPKTIREGAEKGTLPGHKYPARSRRGRWRFKKADIDRFLKKPAPPRRLPEATIWK